MSAPPKQPKHPSRRPNRAVRAALLVLVFLAPIKAGSLIVGGEMANFPVSGWDWVFAGWPGYVYAALCGAALTVVLLVYPVPGRRRPGIAIPAAWLALALTACIGLIRTTERDAASLFLMNLAGSAALAWAVFHALAADPGLRRGLVIVITASVMLASVRGWQQHFGGLAQTREFAVERARASGKELTESFLSKLEQTRVYGHFVYPNSYAAFLILTGPLALLALVRAGRRVEPVKISVPLFAATGGILWAGALWWSKSRGGLLALAGGSALAVLSYPDPRIRRLRWPLVGAAALAGLGGVFAAGAGRDLLSASTRFDYYATAARIFARFPLTGAGLGEFFPYYLQMKPIGAEISRAPHNMLLSLLSQAGIVAGCAALVCLAVPAWIGLAAKDAERIDDLPLLSALIAGTGAWAIHSLLDFNILIPALTGLAPVLCLLAVRSPSPAAETDKRRRILYRVAAGLVAAAALASARRIPGEYAFQRLSDRLGDVNRMPPVETALSETRRVAGLLPGYPAPWVILAGAARQYGSAETELTAWNEAAARAPHRASFPAGAARVLLGTGRFDEAAERAAEAVRRYPGEPAYHLLLAGTRAAAQAAADDPSATAVLVRDVLAATASIRETQDAVVVSLGPHPADPTPTPPARREALCRLLTPLADPYPESGKPVVFRPVTGSVDTPPEGDANPSN